MVYLVLIHFSLVKLHTFMVSECEDSHILFITRNSQGIIICYLMKNAEMVSSSVLLFYLQDASSFFMPIGTGCSFPFFRLKKTTPLFCLSYTDVLPKQRRCFCLCTPLFFCPLPPLIYKYYTSNVKSAVNICFFKEKKCIFAPIKPLFHLTFKYLSL